MWIRVALASFGVVARWDPEVVPVTVHVVGTEEEVARVAAAIDDWRSDALCVFPFGEVVAGPPTAAEHALFRYDGEPCPEPGSEAGDPRRSWCSSLPRDAIWVEDEGMLRHEVGHALGLGHSCGEGEACTDVDAIESVMYWVRHGDDDPVTDADRAWLAEVYAPVVHVDCPSWVSVPDIPDCAATVDYGDEVALQVTELATLGAHEVVATACGVEGVARVWGCAPAHQLALVSAVSEGGHHVEVDLGGVPAECVGDVAWSVDGVERPDVGLALFVDEGDEVVVSLRSAGERSEARLALGGGCGCAGVGGEPWGGAWLGGFAVWMMGRRRG